MDNYSNLQHWTTTQQHRRDYAMCGHPELDRLDQAQYLQPSDVGVNSEHHPRKR